MTLRELFREFVIAMRRREDQHDRDMTHAHTLAGLTRGTKGLPKLQSLLSKRRRLSGRQSPEQQAAMWQVAAARFGGTFRPLDRTTKIVHLKGVHG